MDTSLGEDIARSFEPRGLGRIVALRRIDTQLMEFDGKLRESGTLADDLFGLSAKDPL